MKTIPSTQARRYWARMLGRVEHRGQRYGIERNGRVIAALIPIDEVDVLLQLEDELDFQNAREMIDLHRGQAKLKWEDVLAYDGDPS